jgi:predicted regulator of Ras-like GTPase activity (Roadblock/LC7/MglB family)
MSANDAFERILSPLREVPGVEGVFVSSASGGLLARDSRLWLPDDALSAVSSRIATLFEAVNDGFDEVGELTLAFDPFLLALRRQGAFILAALVRPNVNAEAVRMASNIALRQLQQRTAQRDPARVPPLPQVAQPGAGERSRPAAPPNSAAPKSTMSTTASAPAKKKKNDIWG